MAARNVERAGFDTDVRVHMLELDADRMDAAFEKLVQSVDHQIDEFREAAATNTKILIGILVSLATAAVLLALNLVVS